MEANHPETWKNELEKADKKRKSGRITSALSHLRTAAGELTKVLEVEHRLQGSESVRVVHYTSLATAYELLNDPGNQYLRLSDSVHLTDPQEGWHVFRNTDISDWKERWLESSVSHAYMLSFFEQKPAKPALGKSSETNDQEQTHDHLSHWRAYGHNGRGCSFQISVPTCKLYSVNYNDHISDEAERCILSFVDTAVAVWDHIIDKKHRRLRPDYERLIEPTFSEGMKCRFLHKHPSYKHECELRAITLPSGKVNAKREMQGIHIRHYIEDDSFRMDRLLNSECRITVGPDVPFKNDVAKSVEAIVSHRKEEDRPRVYVSEIPYRTI